MQSPPQNKYDQASQNVFMSSVVALANVLALVVAFFATPIVYAYSLPHVQAFCARYYADGFEEPVAFIWWAVCGLTIFFGARASLPTGLIMAAMTFIARFA